jgi:thiol-disulfide isomerase/thioredoxin
VESNREFLVACLCAAWCDTCVAYRDGFLAMAARFPRAEFRWVDIEEEPDAAEEEDLEVENFPTVRVTRDGQVLFHGTLLPMHSHLERLLTELLSRPDK